MRCYIETSWESLHKFGEELCGDKVEIVQNDEGTLMVLSDGLGSGVKANILSSLTAKIISTMLSAGVKLKDVVETIASTLPVCSVRQVAYSTFTVIQVGKDGQAYLVEFDNPSLILIREGKRAYIPWEESVISGKRVRQARMQWKLNDLAVLFSDGVIHAGIGRTLDLGWQHENVVRFLEETYTMEDTCYDVQHRLVTKCNELYQWKPGDDTTVAAMRLRVPVPACVLVGPPVRREEDAAVVEELLNCPGMKVVCGGTTSQIVSRHTGRELQIQLQYLSRDVPPAAAMEGIDLVTEGVVTLGKTLDLMEEYIASKDPGIFSAQSDGAHLLARALVIQCTSVKFIVGRALNPAHQNPDMPISLSIKLRLVKDIAAALRRIQKPVELKYC